MTDESPTERSERLLAEMTETLDKLIHWFTAIRTEIANGDYSPSDASNDWEALTYNDGVNIISLLAEYGEEADIEATA